MTAPAGRRARGPAIPSPGSQPVSEPLLGAVVAGGGDARRRPRRAGRRRRSRRRRRARPRAPACRGPRRSSSETLSACAARASARSRSAWATRRCSASSRASPSAAWLASVSAIRISSGDPGARRGRASTATWRTSPAQADRHEQGAARPAAARELGAELGAAWISSSATVRAPAATWAMPAGGAATAVVTARSGVSVRAATTSTASAASALRASAANAASSSVARHGPTGPTSERRRRAAWAGTWRPGAWAAVWRHDETSAGRSLLVSARAAGP